MSAHGGDIAVYCAYCDHEYVIEYDASPGDGPDPSVGYAGGDPQVVWCTELPKMCATCGRDPAFSEAEMILDVIERERDKESARYDEYIDSKIDEAEETGRRVRCVPFRPRW